MKNIKPVSSAHCSRCVAILLLLFISTPAFAVYDSGSDGSLGDLILDGSETQVEIALPPDGVLHYESISIAAGVTVTFTPNADNTQVVMLATGDVLIDGTIDLNGKPSYDCKDNPPFKGMVTCGDVGGPGGSRGSDYSIYGQGPGGNGYVPLGCSQNVTFCKPEWIVLYGGSSGGRPNNWGANSGSGGGAITIASSGAIVLNGQILANSPAIAGGGKIRLVADTVTGNGLASARNGTSNGSLGMIKFEAFLYTGTVVQNTFFPVPILGAPKVAVPYPFNERPRIVISKVDNQAVTGTGTFPPDVSLIQEKLITVDISTEFIPVGTILKLAYRANLAGNLITDTTPVTGTFESGAATGTFTIKKNATLGAIQAWVESIPIP